MSRTRGTEHALRRESGFCVATGSVWCSGRNGRVPLPGTRVSLAGTDLHATSDTAGHYRLNSIPAGKVIVVASPSYLGFNSATFELDLGPGDSVVVNFGLTIDVLE